MKRIFRYANIAVLIAAFIVLGAVAGFGQDPAPTTKDACSDAEGQTALSDKVRELFQKPDLDSLKLRIDTGKQFLDKYGACPPAEEFSTYLKTNTPKWEKTYADKKAAAEEKALTDPFDAALKAKNFDDVYNYGKQILVKYPDKYRTVEIVLGAVGGDEAFFKGNNKYADDTLKFASQSIADLEAGKSFLIGDKPRYGLSLKGVYNFEFSSKDDALGWLNLYIGYITNIVKKDKAGSLSYLYKATQAASESKTKPAPYALIGHYYIAEGDKLSGELKVMLKELNESKEAEDVIKQKLQVYKAKEALFNGTNERAVDAFARALSRITDATYKAEIKKALDFSYDRRFGKMDGLDAWVANAQKQPFVDPTTPVTPVFDPEPAAPATTTTGTPTTTTAPAVKPGPPPAKPPTTAPAKPATTTTTKPAANSKPQAKMKKAVVKRKGA